MSDQIRSVEGCRLPFEGPAHRSRYEVFGHHRLLSRPLLPKSLQGPHDRASPKKASRSTSAASWPGSITDGSKKRTSPPLSAYAGRLPSTIRRLIAFACQGAGSSIRIELSTE